MVTVCRTFKNESVINRKRESVMQDELDILTNEIEQGFMQRGGWKTCRFLLERFITEREKTLQESHKVINKVNEIKKGTAD